MSQAVDQNTSLLCHMLEWIKNTYNNKTSSHWLYIDCWSFLFFFACAAGWRNKVEYYLLKFINGIHSTDHGAHCRLVSAHKTGCRLVEPPRSRRRCHQLAEDDGDEGTREMKWIQLPVYSRENNELCAWNICWLLSQKNLSRVVNFGPFVPDVLLLALTCMWSL